MPTKGESFAIIRIRQFKTLRSTHRFGYRWNVGSSNGKSHDGARNAPIQGASSSVVLTGHPTASPEPRQGIAPSFFCRKRNTGKRKEITMKLLMKILKNIILLPFLPIRLGWRWSAGAKASKSYLFGKKDRDGNIVHSEKMDSSSSRLVGTIFIAGIIYYGVFQGISYVVEKFSSRSETRPTPVVERQENVEQSTVNQ